MAVQADSKKPTLESTTLWDFPRQNYGERPHGDNKFNGVTPAFIIWNLLQRYTKKEYGENRQHENLGNSKD